MYRLIIADDELRTRRGLSLSVDWKSLGFLLVGSFEDGSEVISFMKKNKVDVVFTDVEMLKVTGLELSEWIVKNAPETMVVFISGHQDFEYARKALSAGVFEYVLKPINLDEIQRVFERVKTRLDSRFKNVRNIEDLKDDEKEHLLSAEWIVERTQNYVRDNMKKNLSLDDIAEGLHVSKSLLVRQYKKYSGETVMEYVFREKMEHAIALIKRGVYMPDKLAAETGYHDVKYFQRLFKKYTGYSVKDYFKLVH